MRKIHFTCNPSQTKKIGQKLAKEILKSGGQNKAIVLGLEGDLGGGKTTFLQGFAKGLMIKQKILSPTFIIMRRFKIRENSCLNLSRPQNWGRDECKFANFYHIDCYRIAKPKEILDLGFKEIISSPQNIVAIEWADRIRKIIPKNTVWIKFNFVNKNTRKINIKCTG